MLERHMLRVKRHRHIRSTVQGTPERPRLSVFRGNQHLYAQVIDDTTGKTLIGRSDKGLAGTGSGIDRARALGTAIAQLLKEKKIETLVFDRGGFHYHGQVKALADTLREHGIKI